MFHRLQQYKKTVLTLQSCYNLISLLAALLHSFFFSFRVSSAYLKTAEKMLLHRLL